MATVNSKQLVDEMDKHLFHRKSTSEEKSLINFILSRFFHYSIDAILHGYPLISNRIMQIKLSYCLNSELPKYYRKVIKYSQKAFGYSFFLVVISTKMKEQGYTFFMNKKMQALIEQQTETDIVYKFMGREK